MTERIIAVFLLLVGGVWAFLGLTEYGLWIEDGPGGGFIPVVVGILLMLTAVVVILKNEEIKDSIEIKAFFPVAGVVITILMIKFLGMIIATGLFVFGWLRFMEQRTYVKAGIIGLGVSIFVLGVFSLWLQVPMPTGLFGI